MRRLVLVGLLTLVAAIAILGAFMTPSVAYTQNPYVVGGELEVPKEASTSGSTDLAIVVAVAVAAVAIGTVVALRVAK